MADDLNDILIKDAESLMIEFKQKLIDLLLTDRKLNNDSKSINALEINVNLSSKYIELTGVNYFYYVIHGRGPGRFPPPDPVTGKWKIPFPVAAEIAEKGNIQKYKPVANKYSLLVDELIENLQKQSGRVALAYVNNLQTIRFAGG